MKINPKQILNKVQLFFKQLPAKFKALTMGEKLAYGAIGLGVLFILIALILF